MHAAFRAQLTHLSPPLATQAQLLTVGKPPPSVVRRAGVPDLGFGQQLLQACCGKCAVLPMQLGRRSVQPADGGPAVERLAYTSECCDSALLEGGVDAVPMKCPIECPLSGIDVLQILSKAEFMSLILAGNCTHCKPGGKPGTVCMRCSGHVTGRVVKRGSLRLTLAEAGYEDSCYEVGRLLLYYLERHPQPGALPLLAPVPRVSAPPATACHCTAQATPRCHALPH